MDEKEILTGEPADTPVSEANKFELPTLPDEFLQNSESVADTIDIPEFPVNDTEVPAPPVRRRRKKRYPKWAKQPWQKWLWRHWPPIRFGLICLAVLILVIWLVSMIVGAVGGLISNLSDSAKESTSGYGETVETTLSDTEKLIAADELLAQAEFVAAGYDYQKAIDMLQSSDYFADHPEWQSYIDKYTELEGQLVSYDKMNAITHVFFHTLIVDTSRAFDGEYTQGGYNQYMTTVDEFKAMLEIMYERGYVLVSPYDVAYEVTDETGTHMVYGDIRLPEGKTPFLMSQDDVNYYGYMIGDADPNYVRPAVANADGDGFAHKIVIDENGDLKCEYIDANGNLLVGDYDLVPILETFIQEHPDFSYHGARAMLGLTGYEGVLGYRTKPAYEEQLGSEAYAAEVAAAKEVAEALKADGWLLVSHTYGHPAYGTATAEKVDSDSQKWEDTVQPIVGETDIIIYPYGSDIAGIGKYTTDNAKFVSLYEDGYRYFFNVDSNVAWQQMGDDYFRGGRRNLDGYRMYYNPGKLSDLFDVADVWDDSRPTPVPSIG